MELRDTAKQVAVAKLHDNEYNIFMAKRKVTMHAVIRDISIHNLPG